MSSNIRAKSIEGNVTDSAGNVLRSTKIVIKQATPGESFVVDSVNSDDSGYFISNPIPSGVYDIYESGIRIARTIHSADKNSIQSFKADEDNYDVAAAGNFESLAGENKLNDFKAFIQIEPSEIDIPQYGNTFPLYDFTFSNVANPEILVEENNLWELSQFFGFNNESRITTTRFDVEYYNPLTALSSSYQRVRWSGMPAIKFYKDSKLVIPLDYFSMVLSHPKLISRPGGMEYSDGVVVATSEDNGGTVSINNPEESISLDFQSLVGRAKKGDVLKLIIEKESVKNLYYGIVTNSVSSPEYEISLERLKSSNYESVSEPDNSGSFYVKEVSLYDGMFRGISNIDEDVNEKFSVVENIYAQSIGSEIYNYGGPQPA